MVHAILRLSDQVHVAVKSTSIRLIGELAEWLNKHSEFIGNHHIKSPYVRDVNAI